MRTLHGVVASVHMRTMGGGARGNQSFTILERTYKLSDLNESCVSWLLSDWIIASVLRELSPENRIYSIFSGHRKQD